MRRPTDGSNVGRRDENGRSNADGARDGKESARDVKPPDAKESVDRVVLFTSAVRSS